MASSSGIIIGDTGLILKCCFRTGNGSGAWLVSVSIMSRPCCLGALCLAVSLAMAQQVPPAAPADPKSLASVEGVVSGVNRQPLAGTTLSLLGVSGTLSQGYVAYSDSLGRFSFQGIAPGRYGLLATHTDYSPYDTVTRALSAAISSASGTPPGPLVVTAGQHIRNLEIDMVPMTVLSGKVTDENGDPMPDVTVRPMLPETTVDGHMRLSNGGVGVKTGADGKYRVSVYSGRWYLSFLPVSTAPVQSADDPHLGYITAYYPGVREMPLAAGIDAAGIDVPELNVRLQKTPVFHVRGKVVGTVNPDSRVLPWRETGSDRPSVVDEGRPVAADGTFDIGGLSPGAWTLIVCQYGKPGSAGRRTIHVGDSDLEDVVVAVRPPAELIGSVRTVPDRTGTSVPQPGDPSREVTLTALEPLLNSESVEVGSDGEFAVEKLAAGRYRVDLRPPPPGGFVKSVTLDGRESIDTGIDLSGGAGSSGELQIVVSMTAGEIRGTVTNPDGAPPSAAIVTVMPDVSPTGIYRPDLHPSVRTDAIGHFTIQNLPPGTYRLYAWERLSPVSDSVPPPGQLYAIVDPEWPRLFDSLSAVVTVGENESKQVSLTLISAAKMDAARQVR